MAKSTSKPTAAPRPVNGPSTNPGMASGKGRGNNPPKPTGK